MGETGAKDVSGPAPALDGEGPMWEVGCDAYPHRQVNRSRSWACATLRSGYGMDQGIFLAGSFIGPLCHTLTCFCQKCIQVHQIAICVLSIDVPHVYIIFHVQKKL